MFFLFWYNLHRGKIKVLLNILNSSNFFTEMRINILIWL